MRSKHVSVFPFQEIKSRLIDEGDLPLEIGGDQSAAHGVQDVLLHRLEILKLIVFDVQLNSRLPQLRAETARQVSDGHVSEEVDSNYKLHRFQIGSRDRKRRNELVVREVENCAERDE